MLETIGKTSLVRLQRLVPAQAGQVWLKLEAQNPTGSYKDRVALAMVEGADAEGLLANGTRLLECTGGSTGTALAFVSAVKGYPFTVISSDAYAREKLDSMRAFGAELLIEPSQGGQVTPDLWPRMRQRAQALVQAGGYHWLDQFNNPYALRAYQKMGAEILAQAPGRIDAFCGAVGTAGMIVGVGSRLKSVFPQIKIVALEPDSSAVLSGGAAGKHTIDGVGAGFVPPQFDARVVSEVRALPESEARLMARQLAEQEGIFAGTSTGLNVMAAIQLATELGPESIVLTVACDSGFKYLDGPLYRC